MGSGNRSTLAAARYGEGMTPPQNPVPATIELAGPAALMSLACQKCRKVFFSRTPEAAVKQGIGHAQECGTNKILIAELVTQAGTGDG
jgi:hypothetical protein